MGVGNKRYSTFFIWVVISIVAALVVTVEILWFRFMGVPPTNSFWFLPIPFLAFFMAFFMWSMSLFKKNRNLIAVFQVIISGVVLSIAVLVSWFWMGH